MVGIVEVVIAVVVMVGSILGGLFLYARRYVRVPPNMAMIVFGRRQMSSEGYVIIRGGGKFIVPVFEDYAFLPLNTRTLKIDLPDVISDIKGNRMKIHFTGVAQVKIASDEASLETAAEILLHKKDEEIDEMAAKTIEGYMRSVCSTMTFEAIDQNRDELAKSIQQLVDGDLKKLGMAVLYFVIKDIEKNNDTARSRHGPSSTDFDKVQSEILDRLNKIEARIEKIEKKIGAPEDRI